MICNGEGEVAIISFFSTAALFPIYQHFHKGLAPRVHSSFGKCAGILVTKYPRGEKRYDGHLSYARNPSHPF